MSSHSVHYKKVLGVYDDVPPLMSSVKAVRAGGHKIDDVYTPFAVHGLDKAMGLKESRLHIVAFLFGLFGLAFALWFESYMSVFDWPMNIGGKPHFPLPSFIPVAFEVTVLITSLGMVGTFLIRANLIPGSTNKIIDPRVSDDRFIIVAKYATDEEKAVITNLLNENGAIEIREDEEN